MQKMDATVSSQVKTGGIYGFAFSRGIASMSIKAAVQNDSARTRSPGARPTFYFFFDDSNSDQPRMVSNWSSGVNALVTSPSEFTLVRLMEKKGRREARVGSLNIGGKKTGVMDKDRRKFSYEVVRAGVYRVVPDAPLNQGEYAFIFALAGGGANGALTARLFDFGVDREAASVQAAAAPFQRLNAPPPAAFVDLSPSTELRSSSSSYDKDQVEPQADGSMRFVRAKP